MNKSINCLKVACLFVLLQGCNNSAQNLMERNTYIKVAASARVTLPTAVEMEKLFGKGNVDHCYTASVKPFPVMSWFSEAFFGSRYKITMRMDVEYDAGSKSMKPIEKPKFTIVEVTNVEDLNDGRYMASFEGISRTFDETEWQQFYHANGNFEVLGLKKNTDAIPFFDRYRDAVRKPRVPITLID